MTALSLNALSGGRFILELGASGPQVVEGLHVSAYAGPLRRLQEAVEIVRQAFRGEKSNIKRSFMNSSDAARARLCHLSSSRKRTYRFISQL